MMSSSLISVLWILNSMTLSPFEFKRSFGEDNKESAKILDEKIIIKKILNFNIAYC